MQDHWSVLLLPDIHLAPYGLPKHRTIGESVICWISSDENNKILVQTLG
jgi:hypothetical protein